jgi:hypothetical protein
MQTDLLLLSGPLATLGAYMLWAAYQIRARNRVDLVQFGAAPLSGAAPFKAQFAALHAVQGLSCLVAALAISITGSTSPGVWIFAGISCALGVRRQLLVRAAEMTANAQEHRSHTRQHGDR